MKALIFVFCLSSLDVWANSISDSKPTIIDGSVASPFNTLGRNLLLSSVRIGKVPVNKEGVPDLSRFRPDCSGAIIGNRQVTSAVHCFARRSSNWVYYAEIRESINPDKRKLIRITSLQTSIPVLKTSGTIDTDSTKRGLDLALVNLAEEVPAGNVSPLCNGSLTLNDRYVVAGFGVTRNPSADKSVLNYTEVPLSEINTGTLYSQKITAEKTSTSCFGDSGGGIFKVEANDKLCVAGAVSGNDSTKRPPNDMPPVDVCTQKNIRQVFARVNEDRLNALASKEVFPEKPEFQDSEARPGSPGTLPDDGSDPGDSPPEGGGLPVVPAEKAKARR